MTEPNHATGSEPAGAPARITWPSLPAEPGGGAAADPLRDPAISALLERLGGLPDLPVARHGEVYTALHDELLAALDGSATTSAGEAAHEQA